MATLTTTSMDRQTFLDHLVRSGLLDRDQLTKALDQLPDTHRARLVARSLVERGLLTKFQAEMLLAGRTNGFFLGQYRILEQLGRGGMGRVFKAVHQTMNRVVALKLVFASLLKTERGLQMFQREVQAAARLMHPHIVTAYDANQIGDRHYLIMEYVDGPDLDHLVRERGPLSVGQACDFIRQAAEGLEYAFKMGMVHRDIKPANLLVQRIGSGAERRCQVKILDFGLARLYDPDPLGSGPGTIMIHGNIVLGTPDFLSPEQGRNLHGVDIRSDLYSLGCTFHYLLTGQVPFPGGTNIEKLMKHWTENAVPVTHLRPEIPAAVGSIVGRLMAKDPAKRYQTPAELVAALEPFAVPGPPPWIDPEPTISLVEPAREADATAEDIQLGSLATNTSATPAALEVMASIHLRQAMQREQHRLWTRAVMAAIAIVAGIFGVAIWLMLTS
jgi:serine/threonine protein kinase